MFTTYEINEEFKIYNNRARTALADLISELGVNPEELLITPDIDIASMARETGDIYILSEGILSCNLSGKQLFFLEKKDVVAPVDFFFGSEAVLHSDFAVKLFRFNRTQFYTLLFRNRQLHDLWEEFLGMQLSSMVCLLASFNKPSKKVDPDTRFVAPGDPIIIQETEPDEVYTLLSGSADVFVQEKKVGEVLEGEIFGAMAATTNTRRSASVIARVPCVIMVLPKEHFLSLAETHPHTLLKLIEDMGRIIRTQNQKIMDLETKYKKYQQ